MAPKTRASRRGVRSNLPPLHTFYKRLPHFDPAEHLQRKSQNCLCGHLVHVRVTGGRHQLAVQLPCGHIYGDSCLLQHLEARFTNECPYPGCTQFLSFRPIFTPDNLIKEFLEPIDKLPMEELGISSPTVAEDAPDPFVLNPFAEKVEDRVFPWDDQIDLIRFDVHVDQEFKEHLFRWVDVIHEPTFAALGLDKPTLRAAIANYVYINKESKVQNGKWAHKQVMLGLEREIRKFKGQVFTGGETAIPIDEIKIRLCLWVFMVCSPDEEGGIAGPGITEKQVQKKNKIEENERNVEAAWEYNEELKEEYGEEYGEEYSEE